MNMIYREIEQLKCEESSGGTGVCVVVILTKLFLSGEGRLEVSDDY